MMFFYRSWLSRLKRRRSFARFLSASDSWKKAGRISGFELRSKEAIKAMQFEFLKKFATAALYIGLACVGYAQDAPVSKSTDQPQGSNQTAAPEAAPTPAPAAPTPLPTPAITGPLQAALPMNMEAGPLGQLSLNGVVSGVGLFQNHAMVGNNGAEGAFGNALVFFQKPTGWFQFYVQAGAYDVVSLGSPFISNAKTNSDLWGPVPTTYVKLLPTKNTNLLIGILPTIMGAEYTFDFQNMNIERGLLWNQENAITRGVQINQTLGKFTASFSWNDGYYSNRYSGLSGSLTYTNGPHSLTFAGMGYLGQTAWQNLATPVQNNSTMYVAEYTYTRGKWIVQPYLQYSNVPTNATVGVAHGASTWGGAILASRTLKRGFSLTGRWEYIGSTGNGAQQAVNLMYGPGSADWSITVTPTYQYKKVFARTDIAFVQANNFTPGDAFGRFGTRGSQTRGVVEIGLLF